MTRSAAARGAGHRARLSGRAAVTSREEFRRFRALSTCISFHAAGPHADVNLLSIPASDVPKEVPSMRMRKMLLGMTRLLGVGVMAMAGGMLTWSAPAEADGRCHTIHATQTAVADFATFTTAGEITSGLLKGTTKFTGDPASLTQITSTVFPPVEPLTSSYTGKIEITIRKGTLTTRSVGVFEGVPFGVGVQFDRVIGGTSVFEGADGVLFFRFEADRTGAAFTSSVSGEVCVH